MVRQQIDQPLSGTRRFWIALGSWVRGVGTCFFFVLSACDLGGMTQPAVAEHCGAIGARCALAGGPIGVCQVTRCPPGETPPCYQCTPQH